MKINKNESNSVQTSRLIVKNLPKTLDELSLKKIFSDFGEVTDCQIIFKGEINRQIAFVGFKDVNSSIEARKKMDQTFIKTSKITVDFATEKPSNFKPTKSEGSADLKSTPNLEAAEIDEKRLYITNLPYSITNENLTNVFSKFGNFESANVIIKNGKSMGYGFVAFNNEHSAIRALNDMDKKTVFGRVIHVSQCRKLSNTKNKDPIVEKIEAEKSSFKKLKKKKLFDRLNDDTNWNSSFLNPNTILERISEKLGVPRNKILDNEIENPAVLTTICEKEILDEVHEFLTTNNIDLEVFKGGEKNIERSKTTFLIKNLPYKTKQQNLEELLSQYGKLENLLMAPNRAIAIAEYENIEHSQNAFMVLSDYVYKGTPLYLEWAPENLYIGVKLGKKSAIDIAVPNDDLETNEKTIYIKNLNKSTTEEDLEQMLTSADLKDYKYIKVVKKDGVSLGYGFVEFEESHSAQKMIRNYQNHIFQNHALKLSISKPKETKKSSEIRVPKNSEILTDKLVIKNLPFQTNKQELMSLIKGLINFKTIRLPRKTDGSLRGFAFLQFASFEDCKLGYEALQNLHFYGRKLVIEFGKE